MSGIKVFIMNVLSGGIQAVFFNQSQYLLSFEYIFHLSPPDINGSHDCLCQLRYVAHLEKAFQVPLNQSSI